METTIKKWGNSLAVRLPKLVAQRLALQEGARVYVREERHRVIISPAPVKQLSLRERVSRIRPEHLHGEISWGKPQGKEVW